MKIVTTPIEGLIIIEPTLFHDDRGCFFESYNQEKYSAMGISCKFVQDNESCSRFGVIRGLHFQSGEYAQAKLIRVISGKVFDVAVDLRKDSPSFGQHFGIELSAENKRQYFIPRGFAHGFVALDDNVILQYKCDNYYNKDSESGIRFDDPDLSIDWMINHDQIIVHDRDKTFQSLAEYKSSLSAVRNTVKCTRK